MRNKYLYLGLVVVLLFAAIFFLEENKEDVTEIQYWKLSVDRIEYNPPDTKWLEETTEVFYTKPFEVSLKDGIKKGGKFFLVSNIDSETGKQIQFEGGYNSDNTFRDLGGLRVKSTEPVTEGIPIQDSLQVGDGSPKLTIYSGNVSKVLKIGKKHKNGSTRVILEEGHPPVILSSNSYVFDRFQKGPEEFRQRQLISLGTESIKEISYIDENGKSIRIDNTPYEENKVKKNFWRRLSGTIILLDQKLGEDFFRAVTSLKTDLFPDETKGAGFAIGTVLAPESPNTEYSLASLKVLFSDGNETMIRFHKSTNIGEKKLTPIIRILNGRFQERPVYVGEDTFLRIQDLVSKIQSASAIVKKAKPGSKNQSRKKQ